MSITDRVNERVEEKEKEQGLDYVVLESTDRASLSQEVREYTEIGWVCQGGVAIAVMPPTAYIGVYHTLYAQAMVFDHDTSWLASDEEEAEE